MPKQQRICEKMIAAQGPRVEATRQDSLLTATETTKHTPPLLKTSGLLYMKRRGRLPGKARVMSRRRLSTTPCAKAKSDATGGGIRPRKRTSNRVRVAVRARLRQLHVLGRNQQKGAGSKHRVTTAGAILLRARVEDDRRLATVSGMTRPGRIGTITSGDKERRMRRKRGICRSGKIQPGGAAPSRKPSRMPKSRSKRLES